jgi:hypothetical protein
VTFEKPVFDVTLSLMTSFLKKTNEVRAFLLPVYNIEIWNKLAEMRHANAKYFI